MRSTCIHTYVHLQYIIIMMIINNGVFLYSAHTMLCALHTYYPWSLDLFIHVSFQLPFCSIHHLQPFQRWEIITHIAISVLPGTHLHPSQVKHGRVKCLAQGHSIETMPEY